MNSYQTTFATWNKVASIYEEHFMDIDLYNDTYDIFCNAIKKHNAAVLEIGCGPGCITKYLKTKRPDFNIDATDIAPKMIELAKKNVPAANFSLMDAREINTITKKYDGIMCGFCLPYLSKEDCEKLIRDSFNILNNKGIIYLSTIEGSYSSSGYESGSTGDKAYVYYYEQKDIEQQLSQHGFSSIQTIRKQYNKNDGSVQTHLIFIASKEK